MTKELLTFLTETQGIIHFELASSSSHICYINLCYRNIFYSITYYQDFFRVSCFRGCTRLCVTTKNMDPVQRNSQLL